LLGRCLNDFTGSRLRAQLDLGLDFLPSRSHQPDGMAPNLDLHEDCIGGSWKPFVSKVCLTKYVWIGSVQTWLPQNLCKEFPRAIIPKWVRGLIALAYVVMSPIQSIKLTPWADNAEQLKNLVNVQITRLTRWAHRKGSPASLTTQPKQSYFYRRETFVHSLSSTTSVVHSDSSGILCSTVGPESNAR